MDQFRDNKIYDLKHSKETLELVYNTIKNYPSAIKESDIVLKTGLSVYNVKDALEDLIERHPCHLDVDKENNLLYEFDFIKEKKPFFSRIFNSLKSKSFKLLKYTFKGWITFMIGGYFLVYFPLIAYALSQNIAVLAFVFPVLFIITSILFNFYPSFSITNKLTEVLGLRNMPKKKRKASLLKGFFSGERLFFTDKVKFKWNILKTTFSYVFGDNNYAIDKLDLEKTIVNYIHDNDNRITVSELVAITGWSITKAEKEITKILVNYHGKVYVTSDGVIIYHFPELKSNLIDSKSHTPYTWQNMIKTKPFNNNYTFENNLISFLALMVFVVSGVMGVFGLKIPFKNLPIIFELLNIHLFPFLFSVVFIATFLFNKLKHEKVTYKKIKSHNIYFKLMNRIFQSPEKIPYKSRNPIYNKAITELHGDIKTDEDGDSYCTFPEISKELKSIKKETYDHQPFDFEIYDKPKLLPEWQFEVDFPEGERKYLGENIVMVEKPEEISIYMKLHNRFMGLKLFGLSLLSMMPLLFYEWLYKLGTTGGVISGVFLFLTISGVLYQAANKFNTIVLKIAKGNISLKQLPFAFLGKSKNIPFEEAESLIIGKSDKSFSLSVKDVNKITPITLVNNIKKRKTLEEISEKIHRLIFGKK